MRVLLSGGAKTQNIIDQIRQKFESSGDDMFVVQYIEDIEQIFSVGNYFDKAIIVDQSITHDFEQQDESVIRQKLNRFATNSARRNRKESYIFLTGYDEIANMIYEETIAIQESSSIVVKQGPYGVRFFASLIISSKEQIPESILFKAESEISNDIFESNNTDDISTDIEDDYTAVNVADFDKIEDIQSTQEPYRVTEEFKADLGEEIENVDDGFGDEFDSTEFDSTFDDPSSFGDTEFYGTTWDYPGEQEDDQSFGGTFDDPSSFDETFSESNDDNFDNSGFQDFEINNGQIEEDLPISGELKDYTEPIKPRLTLDKDPVDNNGWQPDELGQDIEMYQPEEQMYQPEEQMYQPEEQMYQPDYYDNNQFNPDALAAGAGVMAAGAMSGLQEQFSDDYYNTESQPQQQNIQTPQNNITQQDINNNTFVDDSYYRTEEDNQQTVLNMQDAKNNTSVDKIKKQTRKIAQTVAARGNNICVTGCGGCGTSTVAFNLANMLVNLGFNVLLVDFDTECKTQSYICRSAYNNMDKDGANLMAAVNGGQGVNAHTVTIANGFHLLTMGIAGDAASPEDCLTKEKVNRFINTTKSTHHFVIYDVPFDSATNFLSDIVYLSDHLLMVTETTTQGIMKMMLKVCNIDSQDVQDTVFSKSQLVFNKYRGLNKLLGNKIREPKDITKTLDKTLIDLIGQDNGLYFSSMHIAGVLKDDPDYELGWFEKVQYSDTSKGIVEYCNLIQNMINYK